MPQFIAARSVSKDAAHRRDLHVLRILGLGLELVDLVRFFEGRQRQLSAVFLEHTDAAANRPI
jgi:hypothetical protein